MASSFPVRKTRSCGSRAALTPMHYSGSCPPGQDAAKLTLEQNLTLATPHALEGVLKQPLTAG